MALSKDQDENEAEVKKMTRRGYQEDMLELTLQRNTIIFLPTGAGKTYVAIMAIKCMAKDLARPLSQGGKRSVFLCNTVVLAKQQAQSIRQLSALKTAVYTGDMNTDAWNRDRWLLEFDANQILVATCQIVLDIIRHGYVTLDQLNVIVFDECHNATKKHPMSQLMSLYQRIPDAAKPRIIGLSGSLLSTYVKSSTVLSDLVTLERTFHSVISTVASTNEFVNVMIYSSDPTQRIVRYVSGQSHLDQVTSRIDQIVSRFNEKVKKWPLGTKLETSKENFRHGMVSLPKLIRSLFTDFLYQMQDLGRYGAMVSIMSTIVELEMMKRNCDSTIKRQLVRQAITMAEFVRHLIRVPEDEEEDDKDEIIKTKASPKLLTLLAFLEEHLRSSGDASQLKALVFVTRRHTAKCLYHILKHSAEAAPDRFPIRPDFMTGNNSALSESIHAVLENKWNKAVLERFKKNETNLIVTTSVLEEGVDLQMCNLVICYDSPSSYRAYVQSKGRARMANSTYALLVESDKHSTLLASLNDYQNIERILHEYLVGKTIDRQMPTAQQLQRHFAAKINMAPFRTATGALLEEMSVRSLVNRYTMCLPVDMFSDADLAWTIGPKVGPLFTIRMRLPMQSCVKDTFTSDPSPDFDVAKRSAAFKACLTLYDRGELDDHLMPFNKLRRLKHIDAIYFPHWNHEEFVNDTAVYAPDTTRMHSITYPDLLSSCSPTMGATHYLYTFTTIPHFESSTAEAYHQLITSPQSFGLLTTKQLPRLAEFTLHQSFGSILVTVQPSTTQTSVGDIQNAQLLRLIKFHNLIFDEVVGTKQPFLANDWANMENSFLIVPTNASNEVDWDVVNEFQSFLPCPDPPFKRSKLSLTADDFMHRIVYPWYRSDSDTRYVVIKVHEHLTPLSAFPGESHDSYAAYILDKYNVGLTIADQFMLEVKAIHPSISALARPPPRAFAVRGPEMLIPEFCHNLRFPGALWIKAMLLPSILHRLHFLLNAEAVRVRLNQDLCPTIIEPYMPWPLVEDPKRDPSSTRPPEDNMPMRSIVIPNPEETQTRTIPAEEFVSLSGIVDQPWTANDEPIDLSRQLFNCFQFELDYFFSFTHDKMKGLTIDESAQQQPAASAAAPSAAICDVGEETKKHLRILHILPTAPNRGLDQCTLVTAITTPAAQDLFDSRRQTMLGQSFLNMTVAMFLLLEHPDWHLGWLRDCHAKMLSTRNLAYVGIAAKLPGVLKIFQFCPRNDWTPPRKCVPRNVQEYVRSLNVSAHTLFRLSLSAEEIAVGTLNQENMYEFVSSFLTDDAEEEAVSNTVCSREESSMNNFISQQRVLDQQVADSLHAIVGECLRTFGVVPAGKLLTTLNIVPATCSTDASNLLHASSSFVKARLNAAVTNNAIDDLIVNYAELESKLGYRFKDRGLLLQALTHPTFSRNTLTDCNHRLSFLGAGLVDLLISSHLSERADHLSPDELLDLRAALTSNVAQACYAVRYGMQLFMLVSEMSLSEKITSFVLFQEHHRHCLNDQVLLLIDESDSRMGEFIDVPTAIGEAFSAVIAAIFVDSGNDLIVTWNILYSLVRQDIEALWFRVPRDVVQRLADFPGAKPKFDRAHVDEDVVMVNVRFTRQNELIQVQGFGKNAALAKKAAAKVALHSLLQ